MQQRFAEFLVFGGPDGPMTKREAAIAAGYSKDRAMREGSELTKDRKSTRLNSSHGYISYAVFCLKKKKKQTTKNNKQKTKNK